MKTAIVAIAYNRKDSLKRLLDSVTCAEYGDDSVDLIISIDKSDTDEIERFADDYSWSKGNKIVVKHKENLGLRKHILSQGRHFDKYDALVILEDDIIVSPAFYLYTKQTVDRYSNDYEIAGISLYSFPLIPYVYLTFEARKNSYDVYYMQTAQSWGEVWLKKQWFDFYDWYLKHEDFTLSEEVPPVMYDWKKSWLKYHTRYCIENNKHFIYPYFSFSSNCGTAGTHAQKNYNNFQTVLQENIVHPLRFPVNSSEAIRYDAFFQSEDCYSALCLNKDELCIDLYGQRKEYSKPYLLSCKNLNFKIIRTFGLKIRPIEMNVIKDVRGDDIFLYDTTIEYKNKNNSYPSEVLLFSLRLSNFLNLLQRGGIFKIFIEAAQKIYHKFHRLSQKITGK